MSKTTMLRVTNAVSPRAQRSSFDTLIITQEVLRAWAVPPFQRPIRENEKVRAVAGLIKANGGVIPDVITLGVLDGVTYRLDGQHRLYAFELSGVPEGYADVRTIHCASMAEMGQEFVNLNSRIVSFRPDDFLRGLEGTTPGMAYLRQSCPFVGYDMIRRGPSSPILSMSMLLRSWAASGAEVPTAAGFSALKMAASTTLDDARACSSFLLLAERAWGRDHQYARLWGSLNLTLCMWLYRRLVLGLNASFTAKVKPMDREQFAKCLMSLSAWDDYLDWLVGRGLTDRDRSPAYARIKSAFVKRVEHDTGKRPMLPQPAWAMSSGHNCLRRGQ